MTTQNRQLSLVKYSKEDIIEILENSDRAVERAILAIYSRQTDLEKCNHATLSANGKGFTGAHGFIGSSMAQQIMSRGYLTKRQIGWWRVKPGKSNRMRIATYANQLLEIAEEKRR